MKRKITNEALIEERDELQAEIVRLQSERDALTTLIDARTKAESVQPEPKVEPKSESRPARRQRKKRTRLNRPAQTKAVLGGISDGLALSEIAEATGISLTQVHRLANELRASGRVAMPERGHWVVVRHANDEEVSIRTNPKNGKMSIRQIPAQEK